MCWAIFGELVYKSIAMWWLRLIGQQMGYHWCWQKLHCFLRRQLASINLYNRMGWVCFVRTMPCNNGEQALSTRLTSLHMRSFYMSSAEKQQVVECSGVGFCHSSLTCLTAKRKKCMGYGIRIFTLERQQWCQLLSTYWSVLKRTECWYKYSICPLKSRLWPV